MRIAFTEWRMFKLIWKFFKFPGITETNAFYLKTASMRTRKCDKSPRFYVFDIFLSRSVIVVFLAKKRQENNEVDMWHLYVQ